MNELRHYKKIDEIHLSDPIRDVRYVPEKHVFIPIYILLLPVLVIILMVAGTAASILKNHAWENGNSSAVSSDEYNSSYPDSTPAPPERTTYTDASAYRNLVFEEIDTAYLTEDDLAFLNHLDNKSKYKIIQKAIDDAFAISHYHFHTESIRDFYNNLSWYEDWNLTEGEAKQLFNEYQAYNVALLEPERNRLKQIFASSGEKAPNWAYDM